MKARITLDMPLIAAMRAICEGNPGAVDACSQLFAKGAEIDPDAPLGGLNPLLSLSELGIYGHRIWLLYKDVCGMSPEKLIALLRANNYGHLSAERLNHAIDNRGKGIDVEAEMEFVKSQLPRFNTTTKEAASDE